MIVKAVGGLALCVIEQCCNGLSSCPTPHLCNLLPLL